jgi:hypothetical protein
MLIPLGILASAGGVPTGDYELIETAIVSGSSTTSVTFNVSAFDSTYKHLQIRFTSRSSTTFGDDVVLRFNNDTSSNYSYHLLVGGGSSVQSFATANAPYIKGGYTAASDQSPSQSFGGGVIDLLDVYSTTKNKTTRNLTGGHATGGQGPFIMLWSGNWRSTASVSTITLSLIAAANFVAGSRFSIYGIKG